MSLTMGILRIFHVIPQVIDGLNSPSHTIAVKIGRVGGPSRISATKVGGRWMYRTTRIGD